MRIRKHQSHLELIRTASVQGSSGSKQTTIARVGLQSLAVMMVEGFELSVKEKNQLEAALAKLRPFIAEEIAYESEQHLRDALHNTKSWSFNFLPYPEEHVAKLYRLMDDIKDALGARGYHGVD